METPSIVKIKEFSLKSPTPKKVVNLFNIEKFCSCGVSSDIVLIRSMAVIAPSVSAALSIKKLRDTVGLEDHRISRATSPALNPNASLNIITNNDATKTIVAPRSSTLTPSLNIETWKDC